MDITPLIDQLESRRLMASDVPTEAPVHTGGCCCAGCLRASASNTFAVSVNFAPLNAPSVRGHKLDYGAAYGRRGNGMVYGWSSTRITTSSFTNDPRYDDIRAETNIPMGDSSWSIEVPNGWYHVRALMGDPNVLQADYRVNAEETALVKGAPYTGFPFVEGDQVLYVSDGVLTLTSDEKSVGNRLAAVSIRRTSAPQMPPMGTAIQWSSGSPIQAPYHRAESGAVRIGDTIYNFGGFRNNYDAVSGRMDILDLKSNSWTRGASLPWAQTHWGVAHDDRYIYIAGGQVGPMLSINGTNQVWRYDTVDDAWAAMRPIPEVRFGGQMQLLNGRLHFVGGNDASRVRATADHFIFDLNNPKKGWYVGASLPSPTDHHSSIVVNDELYVLGGEVEHGTSYLSNDGFYKYDANANKWITLPPLPERSSHFEAATLTDGRRIFLIGGQTNAQQLSSSVRSYDIARNRWIMHTDLPTARKAGVAWIEGNRLFYMTGDDVDYGEPRWTYEGVIG